MDQIDWEGLARELGLLRDTGTQRNESGGSDAARAALERILGTAVLRGSVDHYVARLPGAELARSVAWLLRSPSAMERCHEIYRDSPDLEHRRSAVELLRVVADQRALDWVPEFLADPDPGIQNWGIGVVDQLLFSGLAAPEDCEPALALAEAHTSESVRRMARTIRARQKAG